MGVEYVLCIECGLSVILCVDQGYVVFYHGHGYEACGLDLAYVVCALDQGYVLYKWYAFCSLEHVLYEVKAAFIQ